MGCARSPGVRSSPRPTSISMVRKTASGSASAKTSPQVIWRSPSGVMYWIQAGRSNWTRMVSAASCTMSSGTCSSSTTRVTIRAGCLRTSWPMIHQARLSVNRSAGDTRASSVSVDGSTRASGAWTAGPGPAGPGPAVHAPEARVEPSTETDDALVSPADRFTLSRAWWIIGQLVRRHPALMVTRVVDDEQVPLLIVHDAAETIRVQFDLPAWIQYMTPDGLRQITWGEVFAEADPLAVLRTVEIEVGLGVPIEARDSPQSLVYRTIACALALGLDSPATWQAVHARID